MTDEQLKAIWQRWERSTPGEWFFAEGQFNTPNDGGGVGSVCAPDDEDGLPWYLFAVEDCGDEESQPYDNAAFIANAHQDIPALRAHIEALTAENERLRAAHNKLLRETDTYRWMVNDNGAGYPFVQDVAIKGNEGKQ